MSEQVANNQSGKDAVKQSEKDGLKSFADALHKHHDYLYRQGFNHGIEYANSPYRYWLQGALGAVWGAALGVWLVGVSHDDGFHIENMPLLLAMMPLWFVLFKISEYISGKVLDWWGSRRGKGDS